MKKLLYLVITLVLYLAITSFASQSTSLTKSLKMSDSTKTLNVNVDAKVIPAKENIKLNDLNKQYLESSIELNNMKLLLIEDLNEKLSNGIETPLTKEQSLEKNGWTHDKIVKRIRADTTIRFISNLLLVCLILFSIWFIGAKGDQYKLDLKVGILLLIFFLITSAILGIMLPLLLSYIFNREYLILLGFIPFT
jgi:hypothetical protein